MIQRRSLTRHLSVISLLSFAAAVSGFVAHAQDRLDPVAMGTARSTVATARGMGAVTSNPGALDLDEIGGIGLGRNFSFSIYNFGASVGATYFNSEEYDQLFAPEGEYQTAVAGDILREKERLLANGGMNLLEVRYATESAGTFALHYGHRVYAQVNLPERLANALATSNIAGQNFIWANDSGVGATWTTELGLSYGKSFGSTTGNGWLPQVGLGLTAKLVQGIVHASLSDNSIVTVDQVPTGDGIGFMLQGGYTLRSAQPDDFDPADAVGTLLRALPTSTAGTGVGVTAGLGGVLLRQDGVDAAWFGIVAQDIGEISWSGNTTERTYVFKPDTLTNQGFNESIKAYTGTVDSIESFTTSLPGVLRSGIGMHVNSFATSLPGRLVVTLEGEFPLNDGPGQSRDPRLGVGGDWEFGERFAVRTGISWGGNNAFGLGLGFGLRAADWLRLDVGTSELDGIIAGERIDLAARAVFGFEL